MDGRKKHTFEFKKYVFNHFKKTIESGKAPGYNMIQEFFAQISDEFAGVVQPLDWKQIKGSFICIS